LPVSDLDFWTQKSTLEKLQTTLNFATDDTWRFEFSHQRPATGQLTFELDATETLGKPDSVYLFPVALTAYVQ